MVTCSTIHQFLTMCGVTSVKFSSIKCEETKIQMSFLHHTVVEWNTFLIWSLYLLADFLQFHFIPPIAVHSLDGAV
jgi:hypothetical protein